MSHNTRLALSDSLSQEQKIEAFFDAVNQRMVVAIAVSPSFFEALKAKAGEFIKSGADDSVADTAKELTFDGVQLFIKNMRDDFRLINSEEEFDHFVKE
jgi:hypothetical protein